MTKQSPQNTSKFLRLLQKLASRKLPAWQQIFIGMLLGILAGFLLGQKADYLKPIGDLFINAIHMIVTPVVFTAIVAAVLSVGQETKMGKITFRAFIYYFICMLMAALIGVGVSLLFKPGNHFHPILGYAESIPSAPTFRYMMVNLIPQNPFKAFVDGNILQIVIFGLLFGTALRQTGDKAKPVIDFFNAINRVVFRLATMVIGFAPYGVFALIAWTFGHFGLSALKPLAKFVACVYTGCFLQMILVYALGIFVFLRENPITFFKNILTPMTFAYTISSSAATLPLSMRIAEDNLNINPGVSRFLLPLGANFNLNGLCIYLTIATVFAADLFNIHLGVTQYVTIILTTILTAMGTAAVPGSALIVMGAVMTSVGIPLGAIALIAGVDRFNDMMQTATNVTGDLFVALYVAKRENQIEVKK